MPEAHLSIRIDAPVSRVWERLADLARYPEWNSAVRFRGTAEVGRWALLTIRGRPLPFITPVRFVTVDPDRELCWTGGVPGIVVGTHYFRLTKIDNTTTELLQGERFQGLAVGPLWSRLEPGLLKLYRRTNEDLRRAAEADV